MGIFTEREIWMANLFLEEIFSQISRLLFRGMTIKMRDTALYPSG